MKNLLLIVFFLFTTLGFGQEGVKAEGNTVKVSEIAAVWPGCDSAENKENCFSQKFLELVKTTYKYPRKDTGDFLRGKATIKMHINKEGLAKIDTIETKEPRIKAALEKMLTKLPKMTPAKKAGKFISMKYTIPLDL